MDFEDIMLSEITGQRETNGYITYMQNLENNNTKLIGKEPICGYHKWGVGGGAFG